MKRHRPSHQTSIFILFCFLFGTTLLYGNTFRASFTFDDSQIFENYFITSYDFSLHGLQKVTLASPNLHRVLPNISFVLNYHVGGSDVRGYHLVNTLLHGLTAFSFYLLAQTILTLPVPGKQAWRPTEIALVAALIWAVHPLQTNAVTYIIQRMTSMAALFYILAILCYLKARLTSCLSRQTMLFVSSFAFGAMAMFSKENSAMLPVMLAGCELFFLRGPESPGGLKKVILILAGALGLFALISLLLLGTDPLHAILKGYDAREFTLGQRLLTQTRGVFHYLSLLILPLPSRLNLAYDYQISTSLLAPPQTLLAISGLVGLVFLVFFLYKRDRLISFAVFWFLANLAVESTIIPLELIFEHRMYVPGMFLVLAGSAWAYKEFPARVDAVRISMVILLAILAILTWQRNSIWKNEVTLWSDVVAKSPGLARAHVNLGKAYGETNDFIRAEELYRRAIVLEPESGHAYLGLGAVLESQSRFDEAIAIYTKAADRRKIDKAKLYRNMARLYLKMKDFAKSILYAEQALELNPVNYAVYPLLSTAYFKARKYLEAEAVLQRGLKLFPEKGELYSQLAVIYENQNRLPEALAVLNTAVQKNEVNLAHAYNLMGIVYWRMKNPRDSIASAQKAIELDPGLRDAHVTLGITYEDMGKPDLAFAQFRQAWEKGHNMVGLYNAWAINFMNETGVDKAVMYLEEAIRLEPRSPESHENLARAYSIKGLEEKSLAEKKTAERLRTS